MKKILLLTAMLVASVCAIAQSLTVYYVNDQGWDTVNAYAWSPEPNNNWPGSPATLTSETCKGATVYSFDVDYAKTTKIIFNNGSAQTADLNIDPAKPYCYGGQWFATLAEIEGAGEIVAYYLHGDFKASGSWGSIDLVENNGVWSVDALEVAADASFGVKRTTNGVQDAWYWTVAGVGTDVSATGTYEFGEEKTATTGGNASIKAGTYSISFDPATLILTVTASGSSDEGGSDEGGSDEGGSDEGEGEEGGEVIPTGDVWVIVGDADLVPAGWDNATTDVMIASGADFVYTVEGVALLADKVSEEWGTEHEGYGYKAVKQGTWDGPCASNQYLDVEADGTYNVTFTLSNGVLTAQATLVTTTDLEDIDAEDAVVAAYDLIGRPVAADAKGLVILQYASGKAVKVYNN